MFFFIVFPPLMFFIYILHYKEKKSILFIKIDFHRLMRIRGTISYKYKKKHGATELGNTPK